MLLTELEYQEAEVYDGGEFKKISVEELRQIIRNVIGPYMWSWLNAHWDDRIFSVKFLFIKKTVRVRDLDELWEFVFGDRPIDTPIPA